MQNANMVLNYTS